MSAASSEYRLQQTTLQRPRGRSAIIIALSTYCRPTLQVRAIQVSTAWNRILITDRANFVGCLTFDLHHIYCSISFSGVSGRGVILLCRRYELHVPTAAAGRHRSHATGSAPGTADKSPTAICQKSLVILNAPHRRTRQDSSSKYFRWGIPMGCDVVNYANRSNVDAAGKRDIHISTEGRGLKLT